MRVVGGGDVSIRNSASDGVVNTLMRTCMPSLQVAPSNPRIGSPNAVVVSGSCDDGRSSGRPMLTAATSADTTMGSPACDRVRFVWTNPPAGPEARATGFPCNHPTAWSFRSCRRRRKRTVPTTTCDSKACRTPLRKRLRKHWYRLPPWRLPWLATMRCCGRQLLRPTLFALNVFNEGGQVTTVPHSFCSRCQVTQT